jgi:GNAT superfamily N-acetyltransferase
VVDTDELLRVAEIARGLLAEELRLRCGATAADGVPTTVGEGVHLVVATAEEIRAAAELAAGGLPFVRLREFMSPERVALHSMGQLVVSVHATDPTVPNGYVPQDVSMVNFGQVVAVVDGHAVGHLLLHDSRPTPGERIASDYVPAFDTVSNVWIAHRHRRLGIARALLERARAEYPLVELQRPFTRRARRGRRRAHRTSSRSAATAAAPAGRA